MPKIIEISADQVNAFKSVDSETSDFLATRTTLIEKATVAILNNDEVSLDGSAKKLYETHSEGNYDFSRLNKPLVIFLNGSKVLTQENGTITDHTTSPATKYQRNNAKDLDDAIVTTIENALPNANRSAAQILRAIATNLSQHALLKTISESFNTFSLDGMRLNSFTKTAQDLRSVYILTNDSKTEIQELRFTTEKEGNEFNKMLSADVHNEGQFQSFEHLFKFDFFVKTSAKIRIASEMRYVFADGAYQAKPDKPVLHISVPNDSNLHLLPRDFEHKDPLQPYVNRLTTFLKVSDEEAKSFQHNTFLDWIQTRLPLKENSLREVVYSTTTVSERQIVDFDADYSVKKPKQAEGLTNAEYALLNQLNILAQKWYRTDVLDRKNKILHSMSIAIFSFISDQKETLHTKENIDRYQNLLLIAIGLSHDLNKETLKQFIEESVYVLRKNKANDTQSDTYQTLYQNFKLYISDDEINKLITRKGEVNPAAFFQSQIAKEENTPTSNLTLKK